MVKSYLDSKNKILLKNLLHAIVSIHTTTFQFSIDGLSKTLIIIKSIFSIKN